MAVSASVVDGKVVANTASSLSLSEAKTGKATGGALDKDAFLQLLVAEMKNQDPLEPTNNTEYISQFATFSELEEMQNVSVSVDMQRAQSMVGKDVLVEVTESNGNTSQVQGTVDYVVMEAGKVYVSIDSQLYSFDDVTTVLDENYWEAYNLAYAWSKDLSNLTNLSKVSLSDEADVSKLRETYNKMTDYQKTFIAKASTDLLETYEKKINELKAANEKAKNEADKEANAEG